MEANPPSEERVVNGFCKENNISGETASLERMSGFCYKMKKDVEWVWVAR